MYINRSIGFYGLVLLIRNVCCFENITVVVRNAQTKVFTTHRISYGFQYDVGVRNADWLLVHGQKNLVHLGRNVFGNLAKLRELNVSSNRIGRIESGTFRSMAVLEAIDLAHNAIKEIGEGVFSGLPVRRLHLQNNSISRIALGAFSEMHLELLNLTHNKLSGWNPEWFRRTHSTKLLDFSSNLIEDLPRGAFALLSNATSIFLTSNKLRRIKESAFTGNQDNRKTFDQIHLDGNQIDHLQAGAFDGVLGIKVLNLNGNRIEEIGVEVMRHLEVEVLMVEDNRLVCLSTEIFAGTKMEELDVDGNPIDCGCVKTWLDWRENHSEPAIFHITNLEEECIRRFS